MAIFGRRYQAPEDPGEHIRYMEEQLEFFARQVEKRLGAMEKDIPEWDEKTREALQGLTERMGEAEDRSTALEDRMKDAEDRVTALEKASK